MEYSLMLFAASLYTVEFLVWLKMLELIVDAVELGCPLGRLQMEECVAQRHIRHPLEMEVAGAE